MSIVGMLAGMGCGLFAPLSPFFQPLQLIMGGLSGALWGATLDFGIISLILGLVMMFAGLPIILMTILEIMIGLE